MNIYNQRGTFDCLLACLASAMQRPYEELWPEDFRATIEDAKGTYGKNLDKAFELAGLNRDTDYWCVNVGMHAGVKASVLRQLLAGRRALLQVPSLNNPPPAQHIIFWAGETLYDPSNKQVYRWLDQCVPEYVWIFDERRRGAS